MPGVNLRQKSSEKRCALSYTFLLARCIHVHERIRTCSTCTSIAYITNAPDTQPASSVIIANCPCGGVLATSTYVAHRVFEPSYQHSPLALLEISLNLEVLKSRLWPYFCQPQTYSSLRSKAPAPQSVPSNTAQFIHVAPPIPCLGEVRGWLNIYLV
jgi:hypothetical protein